MKKKIKGFLRKAGIKVNKTKYNKILDFTDKDIDPISAWYQANGKSYLIRVPLKYCRDIDILAFKCNYKSQSPYIRTLIEYINGTHVNYQGSWLETIHKSFHPKSASDIMGFDCPSCSTLKRAHPRGALMPWNCKSPEEHAENRIKQVVRENYFNGLKAGYDEGDRVFGPVTKAKGELEFNRLIRAYRNINKSGYIKNKFGKDNISGVVLISDKTCKPRYICRGGQHRIAALTALNYRYVDLQIKVNECYGIVRRAEVDHWPTVQNGYLTQKEALALFDRLFAGDPPVGFKRAIQGSSHETENIVRQGHGLSG